MADTEVITNERKSSQKVTETMTWRNLRDGSFVHEAGRYATCLIPGFTRISNELGAGNSRKAQIVVYAAMSITVIETLVLSTSLLVSRNVFGYVFSSDKDTVEYVAKLAPLVSLSIVLDGFQGVLSGIARGCGWQHIGAYINLGAFYLWGIPIAATLAFWFDLKSVGLWLGIQAGAVLQTLLLALVTGFTNWENQARGVRERMAVESLEDEEEQLLS